jgi:hypothetical protein
MAGRKTNAVKQEDQTVILEGEFAAAMDAMRDEEKAVVVAENQHESRVRVVAAQVGYQLPSDCTDPDMIQRDIAVNMRRTAEAMLQVGLGLICLREACQHGEFSARLEVLRFEPRVAQKYMQVARKVSNAPSTAHLLKVVESQTKLLELIVLDDEELEELALTGQTGELKLDDVASMSVKELRKAVRELRGDVESKEKLLTHKNEQLDQAALLKVAPPDERLNAIREEATKHMNDVRGALIGKFSAAIEALDQHFIQHGGDQEAAFVAGLVGQLQSDINVLRDRFGIPDILPAMIPDWVNDPSFAKTGD